MSVVPKPGQALYIGPACGVPFNVAPLLFRVISVPTPPTSAAGAAAIWLEGYALTPTGHAIERRQIYVIAAGIQLATQVPKRPRRAATSNAGPQLPKQRTATTPRPARRTR